MLKAVNIIGMYVRDPKASLDFYAKLGFQPLADHEDSTEVRLGTMRLQFTAQSTAEDKPDAFKKEAFAEPKGSGLYINIEVQDVDALHAQLLTSGFTPSSSPTTWPWGQREFALRDPDGYKLIFYQKVGT